MSNNARSVLFLEWYRTTSIIGYMLWQVREYTIEDFTSLADTLIARVPNITIATDIICGFPTETAADHEKTVQLIQQYKFPVCVARHFNTEMSGCNAL